MSFNLQGSKLDVFRGVRTNRAPAIKNLGAQTEIRWPEHVLNANGLKDLVALRASELKNRGPFEKFQGPMAPGPREFRTLNL